MRVVVLDPSYSSSVGHHQEVNSVLVQRLSAAAHQVEVWADQAGPAIDGVRLVSSGSGYLDPRQWADLGGCLHLAAQLRSQWEQAGHASAPVHLDQSQDKTHFLTNRRAVIIVNDGL